MDVLGHGLPGRELAGLTCGPRPAAAGPGGRAAGQGRGGRRPRRVAYVSGVPEGVIRADDPRAADVRALLRRHLEFAHSQSPPENVHALSTDGLLDPAVTFYSFRRDGELLAIGALKQLEAGHAELKSMHTAEAARGRGIGRAMLGHLIETARGLAVRRVSLETGSVAAFAPARALYQSAGFTECGPFGDYQPSPYSFFMTLALAGE